MEIHLLIKGFIVGLVVAVPIGPVGLLCTQRTLIHGKIHGLISGLGAAIADVIYSLVAVLGLKIVSDFLIKEHMWLRLFSGIFLCILGLKSFLTKRVKTGVLTDKVSYFNNFISTLFITLSNPVSLLFITGVFAGLGIVGSGTIHLHALQLAIGVLIGSMFWWILLSIVVGVFHKRLSEGALVMLTHVFGGILTAIGIVIIIVAVV